MRQSQKHDPTQVARRGRAAGAGEDALRQGASAFARAGFADPELVLRWPDIAGAEVARVAQPIRLQEDADGGVLTLRCAPGAAVLLQHETRALIARVNAYLGRGRVARLRLVTGPIRPPGALPSHPSPNPSGDDSEEAADLPEALVRLGRRRSNTRRKGD
jgi:hypothetical protein